MRIEFLDPNYSANKRLQDKHKADAAAAFTDDIALNLKNLAEKRTDILFHMKEERKGRRG
jgi:hypothetical protein